MSDDLAFATVGQLTRLYRALSASPVEVVQTLLERIHRLDHSINAFVAVAEDRAVEAARRAERDIQAGKPLGPLHGVPVVIKDNIYTRDLPTTAGSRILRGFQPQTDATVVARLRAAGAIILGKTNLPEFAFGGDTANPVFGQTCNPWELGHTPGGSSGGTGAAVAAGMAPAGLGTDTGGSVRIPAAFCGVAGLRPTFGLVPRTGVIPLSWSLDTVGPLARSVEDIALLTTVVAGHDPEDLSSSDQTPGSYPSSLQQGVRGLRIGIERGYFLGERVTTQVRAATEQALRALEEQGAVVQEVSLPHMRFASSISMLSRMAQASLYHEEWLRTRIQDYTPTLRAALITGRMVTATDYLRDQRARAIVIRDLRGAFRQIDVLVTPTVPFPAPKLGESAGRLDTRPPFFPLVELTFPFSIAGLPALSIPCGFSDAGLPLGLQFAGRPFEEGTILRAAYAYEQATRWDRCHPPPAQPAS